MRVVLLGPPGAGKGTQAVALAERWGVPHVSTGDAFRRAVSARTSLGAVAQGYMERGELVPDPVVNGVVAERLGESDCRAGFVLDGYPRTIAQAEALEQMLQRRGEPLDAAVNLAVDEEELVRRAMGRRVCSRCGSNYHLEFRPPRQSGRCDRCGGELVLRDDDQPQTVRQRLDVYRSQTEPLLDFYRQRHLLLEVDGVGSVEQVTEAIVRAVGAKRGGPNGV